MIGHLIALENIPSHLIYLVGFLLWFGLGFEIWGFCFWVFFGLGLCVCLIFA